MSIGLDQLTLHRFTESISASSETEPMRGPVGYVAITGMKRGGFPGLQSTLGEMVAKGDRVEEALNGTYKNPLTKKVQ